LVSSLAKASTQIMRTYPLAGDIEATPLCWFLVYTVIE
jgi:hypothetical protein